MYRRPAKFTDGDADAAITCAIMAMVMAAIPGWRCGVGRSHRNHMIATCYYYNSGVALRPPACRAGVRATHCTHGSGAMAGLRLLAACGVCLGWAAAPLPPRVQVGVSLAAPAHVTDERFLSLAIDQGAFIKPEQWAAWTAKMSDPIVAALCRQLQPAYLRVGGTSSATVTCGMGASPPPPLPQRLPSAQQHLHATRRTYTPAAPYELSAAHWSKVCDWASSLGLPILFGLNLLSNRTGGPNGTDHWQPANALSLISYTRCTPLSATRAGDVAGWELGNEPEGWVRNLIISLGSREIAADFGQLRKLLRSSFSVDNFFIVGPDYGIQCCLGKKRGCTNFAELVTEVVTQQTVDLVTYHFYNIGGEVGAKEAAAFFLAPSTLDLSRQSVELDVNATRSAVGIHKSLPVWLGETATASGGGLAGSSGDVHLLRQARGDRALGRRGTTAAGRFVQRIRRSGHVQPAADVLARRDLLSLGEGGGAAGGRRQGGQPHAAYVLSLRQP